MNVKVRRMAAVLASAFFGFLCLASCSDSTSKHTDITGIIGAMESELSSIKAEMDDIKITTVSGMEFTEGSISGTRVVVVMCGVGKVNAAICAQTLINDFGADRIINTGVSGSLTDELGVNDFVVSTDAVQHDFDVTALGFQKGEIPYTDMLAFPADENLRALAVSAIQKVAPDSKVLEGRICSGDQFIGSEKQVKDITSSFGGLCAEMEGAAIAQVCCLNDTPFVIIRTIADNSDGEEYEQFLEEAAAECSAATLEMIRSL